MKLTPAVIKQFENDQKKFGTKVALFNVLYNQAVGLLHDIGIKKVKTTDK